MNLTKTQRIILRAAAQAEGGIVRFGAGDRNGTRARRRENGETWIIAYSNPEYFLRGRGLLAPMNEPFAYRITDAGRAAVARMRR